LAWSRYGSPSTNNQWSDHITKTHKKRRFCKEVDKKISLVPQNKLTQTKELNRRYILLLSRRLLNRRYIKFKIITKNKMEGRTGKILI
jgi:hypothetical protein